MVSNKLNKLNCKESDKQPISNKSTIDQRKHFDSIANRYAKLIEYRNYDIDFCLIKRLIEQHDKKIVADFGCGTGKYIINTLNQHRNVKVFGLDISTSMMNKAREDAIKINVDNRLSLIEANLAFLPFKTSSIDVIIQGYSMHHVPELDRYQVIDEAKRVLKNNGYYFISEIGQKHYIEAIKKFESTSAKNSKRVQLDDLVNLFKKANFKIISQVNRFDKITKTAYDVAEYLYTQGIVRHEKEIILNKLMENNNTNMEITLHRYHLIVSPL